jgi:hypothetical protein
MTAPNHLFTLTPDLPACTSARRAEVYSAPLKVLDSQAKNLLGQTTIFPQWHLQRPLSPSSVVSPPRFDHSLRLKTHRP